MNKLLCLGAFEYMNKILTIMFLSAVVSFATTVTGTVTGADGVYAISAGLGDQ